MKVWLDLIEKCESNPRSARGRQSIVLPGQPAIGQLKYLIKAHIYLLNLPKDLTMPKSSSLLRHYRQDGEEIKS